MINVTPHVAQAGLQTDLVKHSVPWEVSVLEETRRVYFFVSFESVRSTPSDFIFDSKTKEISFSVQSTAYALQGIDPVVCEKIKEGLCSVVVLDAAKKTMETFSVRIQTA